MDSDPHRTLNCTMGRHSDCHGYVAPLVYSGNRPCQCSCHGAPEQSDCNPRDLTKALKAAERSYYGPHAPADDHPVRHEQCPATTDDGATRCNFIGYPNEITWHLENGDHRDRLGARYEADWSVPPRS